MRSAAIADSAEGVARRAPLSIVNLGPSVSAYRNLQSYNSLTATFIPISLLASWIVFAVGMDTLAMYGADSDPVSVIPIVQGVVIYEFAILVGALIALLFLSAVQRWFAVLLALALPGLTYFGKLALEELLESGHQGALIAAMVDGFLRYGGGAVFVVLTMISLGRLALLRRVGVLIVRGVDPRRPLVSAARFLFGQYPGYRRRLGVAVFSYAAGYVERGFQALSLFSAIMFLCVGVAAALTLAFVAATNLPDLGYTAGGYAAGLVFLPLLALLCRFAALPFGKVSRFLSRQSREGLVAMDKRPPILFLRSFEDDQVTLRSREPFLFRLLSGSAGTARVDHMLVEKFSRYGPVVAIGRPGEKKLPFGAARVYPPDDQWRDTVLSIARSALAIVIVADKTPGLLWEIEAVLSPDLRKKTIFLASPRPGGFSAQSGLHDWLETHGHPPAISVAAFSGADDRLITMDAKALSPDAYFLALQAFFRRDELTPILKLSSPLI